MGDTSELPQYFVLLVAVMASLVAPLTEEAGFRGYAQLALEKRYRPAVAILGSSGLFALAHLTHGVFVPALLLYFLGGIMWGVTAYLTNSILPGIVIHIVADLAFFLIVWPGDANRRMIAAEGPDTWFWVHLGQVVCFTAISVWAYFKLSASKVGSR